MKRFFTPLFMLAALLCSSTARAELRVCGQYVDLDATTMQTITGKGISGTVTYDPSSKTLTLTDATLTSSDNNDGIYNATVEGLRIYFSGTVHITANSSGDNVAAIFCDKNTTFTCAGDVASPMIYLSNTGAGPALKVRGAIVEMGGVSISANASNNHAIMGQIFNNTKPSLNVNYSSIFASAASDKKAVTGFTGGMPLTVSVFNGTSSFDATTGDIVDSSNKALQQMTILPALTIGNKFIGNNGERYLTEKKTGASTASGSYLLNLSTNTLTLNDFNIDGADIVNRIPGLKIVFNGGGTLTNSSIAMDLYADTELNSDGTVVITSKSASAIYLNGNYNLTICMPEFEATSNSGDGINGSVYPSSKLTLKKYNDESVYKFLGDRSNLRIGYIEMEDMDIWTPTTYFNPTNHTLYYNGAEATANNGPSSGSWFKSTNKFTYYNLWVGGIHVNDRNKDNILCTGLTSGKVVYNSYTNTLTLTDVTYKDSPNFIISEIPNLEIESNGTNSVTSTDYIAVYLNADTKLTGSGSLSAISEYSGGIAPNNDATITVNMQTLAAQGKRYGFWGDSGGTLRLVRYNSESVYKFAGEEDANLYTGNLVLENMDIWTLNTYFYDRFMRTTGGEIRTTNDIVGHGTWFKSTDQFTYYPIYVAGTQVNSQNGGNILNPYITSGKVAYDSSTNTLTLIDATIDYQGEEGNYYDIRLDANATANLVVNGNNTLTGNDNLYAPLWIRLNAKLTASGNGTLNLLNGPLYLYGGTFEATGDVGINCNHSSIGSNSSEVPGYLTVRDNAVITAKSIERIKELNLDDNQAIITPTDAKFRNNSVYVGNRIAQDILIQPANYTGIEEVGDNAQYSPDAQSIYDLSGRRITEPKGGIYIVRTKDGKTRKIVKK